MMTRARKGEFLLCRDKPPYIGRLAPYVLFPASTRAKLPRTSTMWEPIDKAVEIPARRWNAMAPESLHLPPGGGPIRIRVEAVK